MPEVVFYHEKNNSGWITKGLDVYPSTVNNDIRIRNKPAYNIDNRAFISFDTSSIPNDAVINGAYLRVRGVTKYSGCNCAVDYCLYGTLNAGDWGRTPEASHIARLPTSPNIWTKSGVFIHVNKTGKSQYRIHDPYKTTAFGNFYAGNSSYQPELHVSYTTGPPPETLKCLFCGYDLGIVGEKVEVISPPPPVEKATTCACGAKISCQVSYIATENTALTCPYCGRSLGVEGIKETVIITNLDAMAAKLQGEIAALDNRIAELQGQLEALRDEFARTKEIIGV